MAGSKKGDKNNGRFSNTNQPMYGDSAIKNAASRAMNEELLENDKKTVRRNKHIKEDVLRYIGDAILKADPKSKKSFIQDFVDKSLTLAKNDPKSKQAEKFLNILFREDLLDQLTELYNKQEVREIEYALYKIRKTLYDKQQEVFDTTDNRLLVINSRRSGKTFMLGRLAVRELVSNPDAHVVYINRSSSTAIRQIRQPLEEAIKAAQEANPDFRIISGSIQAQELHTSNGGMMLIVGNNNKGDIDRLRGERISLCILDEVGHQRNMRELIREVIGPALRDYGKKGVMVMVGTPPRIPHTYIEEIWDNAEERGWRRFHWTLFDNPFIPDKDTVIEEVCRENGVDANSAFIRREYYGEMGVYDTDALFIKKYTILPPPKQLFTHAWVGVDYGFEDKAAVVSVVADSKSRKMYVVKDWSESKQTPEVIIKEVQNQLQYLKENFNLRNDPWVITDTNEKSISYSMTQTYKIPNVFTAYKYDKDYALDQLASWIQSGVISISKDCKSVIEDMDSMVWKRDEETDAILHELDDDVYHGNAMFAVLYVSRQFDFDIMVTGHSKTAKEILDEARGIY